MTDPIQTAIGLMTQARKTLLEEPELCGDPTEMCEEIKMSIQELRAMQETDFGSLKREVFLNFHQADRYMVGKVIDHLASQGRITCKQNAENLTRSDDVLKNQGNVDTLEKVEGLGEALSGVEQGYAEGGKKAVLSHYNQESALNCILDAARKYHELTQGEAE